jgi:hypothetical protein
MWMVKLVVPYQAAGKKAKKGFMTPERKKKLRVGQRVASSH